ncbi:MAG: glycosyltransferase family 39 protein, partial [Terrimicrobiaceae bacterium]|nr:glycosyltransferase family 39 protein [Terrimicrobiaceae bacterium]
MRARASLAACGLAAAITLFGGWLRLAHLTTHPTWWDEHASLFSAAGQLARQGDAFDGRVSSAASPLPKASVAQDGPMLRVGALLDLNRMSNVAGATLFWDRGNGLAFNLLLHFWVKMFGARDAALRSLPWLLGTLAIPAVFCVALQAGGGLAGATAAALLASSNALLVEFSREVRPYSLAVLLGLAATSCLLALARPGASRWLAGAYVGALVALAFTHYLAAPVVFGAHALAALMSRNRIVLLGVVAAGVMATGAALFVWMLWGANLGMAAMAEHDRIWLDRAREGILWWLQPFHWPDALRLAVERPMQMNWPGLVFWPREHPVAGAAVALWLSAAAFGFWQWWRVNPSARGVSAAAILAISAGALFSLVLA